MRKTWRVGLGCVGLLGASACREPGEWGEPNVTPPVTEGPPVVQTNLLFGGTTSQATSKVAPISGGTLLATKDGHAIAADPDRDVVHVVELASRRVVSVPLAENDEPGRIVEGPPGTVFAVARRGGAIVAIDVAQGTARRMPVCAAPRGAAYIASASKLYVACRSGLLAELDPTSGAVTARHQLDADLRDVVALGDDLVVTRFKSAEVLLVARDGSLRSRTTPAVAGLAAGASVTPTVAFRALALPGGGVAVGHISSSNTTLPSGAGAYYGAPCGGSVADLSATVLSTSSDAQGVDRLVTAGVSRIANASGPLDIAAASDGTRVALLAAGNSWSTVNTGPRSNLWLGTLAQLSVGALASPCSGAPAAVTPLRAEGEPIAVAFDANNRWVVQSREPAQLQLEDGPRISLAADSRFDTGLAIFHLNTGGGIACSSCHPEAGEDGHTWQFSFGPRRSQTLEGGASQRAPFHWSGDLSDFDALFDEVMMKRMSLGVEVDPAQRAALRDWLDSVPKAPTADGLDAEAVERGRALFDDAELACATCHSGPDYSDNQPHDVGTGAAFITPSLVDVNMRAPLFHDGCAATLAGRFGPCGGGDRHGITSKLTRAQEADLVAFMQSL